MAKSRKRKEEKVASDIQVGRSLVEALRQRRPTEILDLLSPESLWGKIPFFVNSGNYALNYILSGKFINGGWPGGRLSELYGGFSSGKSLLIEVAIAEAQKQNIVTALDDTEVAFLSGFAEKLHIDIPSLIYLASDSAEDVLENLKDNVEDIKELVGPDINILYCWDSVAQSKSKSEEGKNLTDIPGYNTGKARLLSMAGRKLHKFLMNNRVCFLVSNQTREKVGVLFGDTETTPGGNAIPFWASIRVRLSRTGLIKDSEGRIVGVKAKVFTKKNKIFAPLKECVVDILFDQGIAPYSGLLDLFKTLGYVKTSGSWSSFPESWEIEKKFQGEEGFIEMLETYNILERLDAIE